MPPPPVAGGAVTARVRLAVAVGAAVTAGVTVFFGDTTVLGDTVLPGDTVFFGEAVLLGDTLPLGAALAEGVAVAVELPPLDVGGAEPLAEGRNVVADAEGVPDVQPVTAAEPKTVRVAQPTAVSSARSAVPLPGMRTFFRYPIGQL